eukprot:TRINITY_DN5788_c0_g1_i4.p2 TRINITY_DN5788_c0_g1~~TRINITY_DN5788_c0_g1_i4.p2  ORF type:complete len:219 (+),score=62.88 TRINITY_DN5788_c0_g1_i4:120-776(+)
MIVFFFLMIRRPPRSTHCISSAASDVYKRQVSTQSTWDILIFKMNSKSNNKTLFLTVGSTEFDALLKQFDNDIIYQKLLQSGFTKLIVQSGRGKYQLQNFKKSPNLEIQQFQYTDKMQSYYSQADLILSHCGAGTLLEILRQGKKVLAIVNEELMDNHQIELENFLKKQNYIFGFETIKNFTQQFEQFLSEYEIKQLSSYEKAEPNKINQIINEFFDY